MSNQSPAAATLDVAALMEAWEEGAESFLAGLAPLRDELAKVEQRAQQRTLREQLERALAALGPDEPLPAEGLQDASARALFDCALTVRETWASVHAARLREAVGEAARLSEQERSLRPLFRDAPEHAEKLCQLFGIWGSTLLSLGNCLPPTPGIITHAVIDEAGQCHPAHAVSALLRAEHTLVLGDVHQLAPVIELTADDDARLVRGLRPRLDLGELAPYRVHGDSQASAQALADRAVRRKHTLVDHYRCQPAIISVCDALCGYGLRVHAPARDDASRASGLPEALLWRDLRGAQQRHAGSLRNELELRELLQLVALLLARGVQARDIAVITPYRGQLDGLRQGLLAQRVPLEPSAELELAGGELQRAGTGLALGTVHRFQGGERSIVLFSSVVTDARSLGFLDGRPNLLNVAVSRAQQHFVCLGDRDTLLRGARTRLLAERAHPF